jgi:dipeptidyl aminopeptidase/acylaminoacyl peptidase
VKIIDIETKQIVDFTDGNLPIAWSPNGERLAFGFREAINKMTIRVVLSDGTVETTIDNNWTSLNNLDWSPDGSKLVVTASMEDMEYQFGVFIIDLTADDIAKVDLALDKPRSFTEAYWSPNGQFIGVTTSPTLVSPIDGLIVFDPENGAIKANLKKGREVEKWFWSSAGNAILVNLSTAKRIGIYYWQEDRLEELSPPSFLIEGLENGEVSIRTPVW